MNIYQYADKIGAVVRIQRIPKNLNDSESYFTFGFLGFNIRDLGFLYNANSRGLTIASAQNAFELLISGEMLSVNEYCELTKKSYLAPLKFDK